MEVEVRDGEEALRLGEPPRGGPFGVGGGPESLRVGANMSSDSSSDDPHEGHEGRLSSATGTEHEGHFITRRILTHRPLLGARASLPA